MTYPSDEILNLLSLALLCLCAALAILIIISAFLHKMIGIETLSVFQVCTIAPYLVNDRSIILRMFDSFAFVNGYGKQLFYD
jgi:hypothetical protein